ncbi:MULTISPECIES: DUF3948 family protein, partial [Bacillus cereus group]
MKEQVLQVTKGDFV